MSLEVSDSAYERLWNTVRSDPEDFKSWMDLAKTAEIRNNIEEVRAVFSQLLQEYPLCFGYWRKWKNKEVEHGDVAQAFQVLSNAIQSAPFVHELWTEYCKFSIEQRVDPSFIRT